MLGGSFESQQHPFSIISLFARDHPGAKAPLSASRIRASLPQIGRWKGEGNRPLTCNGPSIRRPEFHKDILSGHFHCEFSQPPHGLGPLTTTHLRIHPCCFFLEDKGQVPPISLHELKKPTDHNPRGHKFVLQICVDIILPMSKCTSSRIEILCILKNRCSFFSGRTNQLAQCVR